jgi:hypothetical protein
MPRTEAVATVTPTAPSADRAGRVAITSGRRIVGAGLTARTYAHVHATEVRNESFMMPRCNCGLRLHREPLARDGTGAETLGWEHLARHIAARRPRHFDRCGIAGGAGAPSQRKEYRTRQPRPACRPGCRRGNIALRVAVPLRGSPCPLGRAMGSRHVTDD